MKSSVGHVARAATTLFALCLPAAALAQPAAPPPATPPAAAPPAAAPAPLSLQQVASTIKPVALSYSAAVTVGGQRESAGTRTLSVARTTHEGSAAWLLLDGQETAALRGTDSLVVRARDLAPVRRATRVTLPEGTATLTMRFTADSVTGRMEMNGQSQALAMANVAGTAASDGVLLLALAGAPLAPGYAASLAVLDPQSRAVRPLTLTVTGREKVTVPAGSYDAWVVGVSVGTADEPIGAATYYVAVGGPVVRVVATSAQMGGATMESVLQSAAAPR